MNIKNYFLMLAITLAAGVAPLQADAAEDASILVEGIKKSNPQVVYDVLNKGTIDFKACGEFDYLDFACCKLTACIEKIEHYRAKHKKWQDRVGSAYDQELVQHKMLNYTTLIDKWILLKKQVQYIVQLVAFYLGLSQANLDAIEDLATDVVEVVADIGEMITQHEAPATPAVV